MTTVNPPNLQYPDMPWLTPLVLTELLEDAYQLGCDQYGYYPREDGGVDWDKVMNRLEMPLVVDGRIHGYANAAIELPLTYEHPLMQRLKREYRKGYKENNE